MAVITGTANNDTVAPGGVSAGVSGGAPTALADVVLALAGADTVDAGGGGDTVYGGTGRDTLAGGFGSDRLFGEDEADILSGGPENDTLDGGVGYDQARYSDAPGAVTVDLAAGTASGAAGNDVLVAIENATGGAYGDTLFGDAGLNSLYGNNGADRLFGRGGADLLVGGAGADAIVGGAGDDQLLGGTEADTFYFGDRYGGVYTDLEGTDLIWDFQRGVDSVWIDNFYDAGTALDTNRNGLLENGDAGFTLNAAGSLVLTLEGGSLTFLGVSSIYAADVDGPVLR